jgi:hypothetical protein
MALCVSGRRANAATGGNQDQSRLIARERCRDVGASSVDRADQSAFPKLHGGTPDGEVCHAVLVGQVAFGGESRAGAELAATDALLDMVGDLHVDELGAFVSDLELVLGAGILRRHPLTLELPRSTMTSRKLCIALYSLSASGCGERREPRRRAAPRTPSAQDRPARRRVERWGPEWCGPEGRGPERRGARGYRAGSRNPEWCRPEWCRPGWCGPGSCRPGARR